MSLEIIFHERNWHRIRRGQRVPSDGRKVQQDHDHRPVPPHGPEGAGHSHEHRGEDVGGEGEHEGVGGGESEERWRNGSHGSGGSPLHNLIETL